MATQRGFNRLTIIAGYTKETTYNTAVVSAMQLARVSSDPLELALELVDDTDLIGGKEEATTLTELVRGASGQLVMPRCTPHFLAFCGKYGLGAIAAAVQLQTTGYRHKFTPMAAFELPSFTVQEQIYSGLVYQYPGCMINSFELATQRKGFFTCSADIIGSGTRTSPSLASYSELDEPFFKAGNIKFWRSTGTYGGSTAQSQSTSDLAATVSDITAKVVNFRWKYNNNISADDLYEFNSGVVRGRAERDRRTQELSFSVELEDTAYLAALDAQTAWSIELDVVTGTLAGTSTTYFGFNLIFPLIKLKTAKVSGGVGKLVVDCEAQVMHETTNSYGSVIMDVYNKQASYVS